MDRRCSYCGSDEHPLELCPKTWSGSANRRWNLYCSYCGSNKHMVEYCPKTYAGPANRRNNPNGLFLK